MPCGLGSDRAYGSTAILLLAGLRNAYILVQTDQRPTIVLTDGCLVQDLDPSGFRVRVLFPHIALRSGITNSEDDTILQETFRVETPPHYGFLGYDAMLIIGQALSTLGNTPI